VATLAIGIGATTAIYSVVRGVLLAPLPFSHPDRVVALYQNDRKKGIDHDDVAPANFLDWVARARVARARSVRTEHRAHVVACPRRRRRSSVRSARRKTQSATAARVVDRPRPGADEQ
jgi:hypothetical protein